MAGDLAGDLTDGSTGTQKGDGKHVSHVTPNFTSPFELIIWWRARSRRCALPHAAVIGSRPFSRRPSPEFESKLIRFAYHSTGRELFYQTLFGTKSIRLSVGTLASENSFRSEKFSLPRSFVGGFGVQGFIRSF